MTTSSELRHRAYFEALGGALGETSEEWIVASATLLLLRSVDRSVLDFEPLGKEGQRAARDAIRKIPPRHLMRSLLIRAAAAVVRLGRRRALGEALRDIGRSLWSQASWPLAHDVYMTGADVARTIDDAGLLLDCLHGAGHALRMMRKFTEAEAQYELLSRTARGARNTRFSLEAALGLAKLAGDRGNFPEARKRGRAIAARARAVGCRPVLSKALHDLGRIAGDGGNFPLALKCSYEALTLCEDVREYDRILVNVARALQLLGQHASSRDALLLLSATAQERDMRWLAQIGLLELAGMTNDEVQFQRYCTELSTEPLTPALDAHYYECVGDGCMRMGRPGDAHIAYSRMLAVAEMHRLSEQTIAAERALAAVRRGSARDAGSTVKTPSVLRIAAAVTDLAAACPAR